MEFEINDPRTQFTATTFSTHKKSAVKQALLLSLSQSRIETSCHWVAEMICSGYFTEIWDVILMFFAKHIHLGNPKLPLYLELRFNCFRREATEELVELRLRNNLVVRRLFAEIIAVLCTSQKQRSYELVTVNKDDLGITNLHEKLRAPNMTYVLQDKDPKELYIPMNELAHALDTKNGVDACYWLEWLLLFEEVCAKKKTPCTIQTREYTLRYQQDIIWLFWDAVLAKTPHLKLATATLNLFKIQYSPSVKRRRRFLLYYAVALCCDPIDLAADIIGNKTIVESVTDKSFLTTFETDKDNVRILRAAYIHGPPGSGKSTLVRTALRANGYDIIEHSATEERAKNLVELIVEKSITTRNVINMFKRTPSKKVILIDDVDCITDKGGISTLIKFIRPKKTNTQRSEFVTPFPIVLIGNTCADKKIKDLVKSCFTLQIPTPSRDRMLALIGPTPYADTILRLSNGNLHKLLKLSKLMTSQAHVHMFETAHVTETSKTFTARLFREPITFDDHFNLNETDRTIVSMLWHENVIDVIQDSRVYVQLLNNMCFADYIDRITFQRQIWQFNQLSSLIKTFYNNWLLHQHMKIPPLKEIRFTKILTKYSTEYNNTLFIQKLCRSLLIDTADLFKLITSIKSRPPSTILEALHCDDISLGDVTRLVRFLD